MARKPTRKEELLKQKGYIQRNIIYLKKQKKRPGNNEEAWGSHESTHRYLIQQDLELWQGKLKQVEAELEKVNQQIRGL